LCLGGISIPPSPHLTFHFFPSETLSAACLKSIICRDLGAHAPVPLDPPLRRIYFVLFFNAFMKFDFFYLFVNGVGWQRKVVLLHNNS
jgi:hypothetical protein